MNSRNVIIELEADIGSADPADVIDYMDSLLTSETPPYTREYTSRLVHITVIVLEFQVSLFIIFLKIVARCERKCFSSVTLMIALGKA